MPHKNRAKKRAYDRRYSARNAVAISTRNCRRNWLYKALCMRAYGGRCVWCGTDDLCLLTVDHVNDDGGVERRSGKISAGSMFYRQLLLQPRRDDLQILCQNCQSKKRKYGRDMCEWPVQGISVEEFIAEFPTTLKCKARKNWSTYLIALKAFGGQNEKTA